MGWSEPQAPEPAPTCCRVRRLRAVRRLTGQDPISQYMIYKAILPSGAGNGASNGRYAWVATIPSGTFTYLDTTCTTGVDCWHIVVPSNGSECQWMPQRREQPDCHHPDPVHRLEHAFQHNRIVGWDRNIPARNSWAGPGLEPEAGVGSDYGRQSHRILNGKC